MRYRFMVCDLSAIETRVAAWLADCEGLLKVFEMNRDPYVDLAAKMYGTTYEALDSYLKSEDKSKKADAKRKRQVAKPGILGAVYRLSGGELLYVYKCPNEGCYYHKKNTWTSKESISYCPRCENDNEIIPQFSKKTGLWDYADKMGVEMSQEQAHEVVRIFRDSYPEICNTDKEKGPFGIWKQLEYAVMDVLHKDHPATVRYVGPNNCVKIDRINILDKHPMMRIQLPSGRYLHYLDARIESHAKPWKVQDEEGNEVDAFGDTILYAGTNQKTKQWDSLVTTHGGKLFENIVQGIARDILAAKLLAFEDAGMPVVGHVHDEGVTLVVDDLLSPTLHDMVEIMSTEEKWAPGLLLGADGYDDPYYHK